MKDDPANLRNLHELVPPGEIAWWPVAPGWYVIGTLLLFALILLLIRQWRHWRANRYRREALALLRDAATALEIAELLRRIALVIAPRSEVASKCGSEWADWIASRLAKPMPEEVRQCLSGRLYRGSVASEGPEALRSYVSAWILHHRIDSAP